MFCVWWKREVVAFLQNLTFFRIIKQEKSITSKACFPQKLICEVTNEE